jgi:HAD superfamily hydrolase (TIGR01509 family)
MTDLKTLVSSKNAIIFDMDGTIVNTEALHAKAATLVLKEMGITIDIESMLTQFYGMTDTLVLKTLCPQLSEHEIQSAILKKNFHLLKIFQGMSKTEKDAHTTPGLFEFLNFLIKEKKKLGVVSASEDIIVIETLKTFGISNYMEIQMGRNQTMLTKPHPEPYLEGMRRLNSTALDTLIFEDSPTGLLSAHASGAEIVRITEFSHSLEKSKYKEIPNFLKLY